MSDITLGSDHSSADHKIKTKSTEFSGQHYSYKRDSNCSKAHTILPKGPSFSLYIQDTVVGHGDANGRLLYPLFTVARQLILQVLGLQLQLGPLLDLLLALSRKLLSLLLHGRDFGLQLSDNALCLLQKLNMNKGWGYHFFLTHRCLNTTTYFEWLLSPPFWLQKIIKKGPNFFNFLKCPTDYSQLTLPFVLQLSDWIIAIFSRPTPHSVPQQLSRFPIQTNNFTLVAKATSWVSTCSSKVVTITYPLTYHS